MGSGRGSGGAVGEIVITPRHGGAHGGTNSGSRKCFLSILGGSFLSFFLLFGGIVSMVIGMFSKASMIIACTLFALGGISIVSTVGFCVYVTCCRPEVGNGGNAQNSAEIHDASMMGTGVHHQGVGPGDMLPMNRHQHSGQGALPGQPVYDATYNGQSTPTNQYPYHQQGMTFNPSHPSGQAASMTMSYNTAASGKALVFK